MSDRAHFLEPLLAASSDQLALMIEGRLRPLATAVEGAFDSRTRNRGLLGRTGLASGAAMVIAPCNVVHTFFMRFAIDVVFAARDGRVLKIYRRLPPWRIAFAFSAFATIELAAGIADTAGVSPGDRLVVAAAAPTGL